CFLDHQKARSVGILSELYHTICVTPQNFNFGYCECVTQTFVSFNGYVFWECLEGPKFKP
ncbi:hypothetical protein Gotur_034461, partial [Gossypium turneri]